MFLYILRYSDVQHFVLSYVFTFWIPRCVVRYDFCIKPCSVRLYLQFFVRRAFWGRNSWYNYCVYFFKYMYTFVSTKYWPPSTSWNYVRSYTWHLIIFLSIIFTACKLAKKIHTIKYLPPLDNLFFSLHPNVHIFIYDYIVLFSNVFCGAGTAYPSRTPGFTPGSSWLDFGFLCNVL